jgi:ribonuclease P protein component
MIARNHRFHGYRGVKTIYRHGVSTRGPLFSIKSLQNPKRSDYRLAVVVSRKVHKSAVARNRIRRRLYETVRSMESDIKGPHDIVLTVFNASVLDEPAPKLARQIKKLFKEAKIIS